MLSNRPIRFSIPAADMQRAKGFYAQQLGLLPVSEHEFAITYTAGDTSFALVPSPSAGQAQYSLLTWQVEDINSSVAALRAQGIVFEDYDLPYLQTKDGIATLGRDKIAWFKDSEGNLLAVAQLGV